MDLEHYHDKIYLEKGEILTVYEIKAFYFIICQFIVLKVKEVGVSFRIQGGVRKISDIT